VLAREVTGLVHGADQVARAEHASSLLFGERIAELAVEDVLTVFEDVPSTELPSGDVDPQGIGLVDLLARVAHPIRIDFTGRERGRDPVGEEYHWVDVVFVDSALPEEIERVVRVQIEQTREDGLPVFESNDRGRGLRLGGSEPDPQVGS